MFASAFPAAPSIRFSLSAITAPIDASIFAPAIPTTMQAIVSVSSTVPQENSQTPLPDSELVQISARLDYSAIFCQVVANLPARSATGDKI
jgi:hypothetical protein